MHSGNTTLQRIYLTAHRAHHQDSLLLMPFINVNNIQLYYEISGKGPRLLYISGTGADLRNKPNIFDSPLTDKFEILAFDQRGLGQSDRPDVRCSMEDYANDAAALLKALDWECCNLVGVSFGGMVAQELALRYADCVERMVFCCTSSGGAGGHSYPFHEMTNLTDDEFNSLSVANNDTRQDAEWQRMNPENYQALLARRSARNAGAGEPNRDIGAKRQLEARIDHDTYDRLPQLKHPVLIAGGRFDGVAPPANLEAIHQQLEHSEIHFYEGGHDFYNHDALAFQAMAEFLKRH
ncbi:MAG: 3-oxoadipate enol-lactonase [bacterium]|jgi:3-oxoadipate enol-lactonase